MLYEVFVNNFQLFLCIMIRILGLFMSAPFFSGSATPFRFKLAFAFFASLVAAPLVMASGVKPPADLAEFIIQLLSNFIFGAGIGLFCSFVISSFNAAAQMFSMQMGMGMNEVYDPISDTQVPSVGNMLDILILLLFLRADGHFMLIQLVTDSFQHFDMMTAASTGMLLKGMISALIAMFEIGVKLALPIIGITLLLDIAMGLISRVAPQFNVMIMGFNIKILAGFLMLWLVLPSAMDLGGSVVAGLLQNLQEWIHMMRPPA